MVSVASVVVAAGTNVCVTVAHSGVNFQGQSNRQGQGRGET